jgi:hypothetical protein
MDYNDEISSNVINMENIKQYSQQTKRGRGRPRKNQIISSDKDKKNKNTFSVKQCTKNIIKKGVDEEIILHLPISLKDLNIAKMIEPVNTTNNENSNIFTIDDINSESYTDSSNSNDMMMNDLKQKYKELEKIIQKLEKEVSEYKALLYDNNANNVNTRKVSKMNTIFVNANTGTSIIVDKTDIACWWCTHNFDNIPCFIPEKIVGETCHVFGCFCVWECAAAYILQMDNSYVWDRYSLLKKLYNKVNGNNDDIRIAPPREVFTKFGGSLTYEEYRKNCKTGVKEYRFIMPPMTSIVPLIEEGYTDNTKVNISLADLNKKNALRRNKPLPNLKNTFFDTMCVKDNPATGGRQLGF